jgi:cbb3-type cytochrome oxidase subunit 1
MRKLLCAASVYLVLGLASGLYYREFTKSNGYTGADGFTQLSVVHTHVLTLGVIVLLIVLALEKIFTLSDSKAFNWFFWVYNLGLVVTAAAMTVNGTLHVLGQEASNALTGISGSGHILLTAGLVLLFVALGSRIRTDRIAAPAAPPVSP